MQFVQAMPEEVFKLATQSRQLMNELVKGITPQERICWETQSCFGPKDLWDDSFYVPNDGVLQVSLGSKTLFYLEEGDAIFSEAHILGAELQFRTDFAVWANRYSAADLKRIISSKPDEWQQYQGYSRALWYLSFATLLSEAQEQPPQIKRFNSGDAIIREGEMGQEIFTLVEGITDVLVEGVKVGQLGPNEIFGALAPLTGTKRTATVVAGTDCTVLTLNKDQFVELVRYRPDVIAKLVQDLAQVITSLNQRFVANQGL